MVKHCACSWQSTLWCCGAGSNIACQQRIQFCWSDHFGALLLSLVFDFHETVMKWVIAMIQPHKFDDVLLALKAAEFLGVTVSDALVFRSLKSF